MGYNRPEHQRSESTSITEFDGETRTIIIDRDYVLKVLDDAPEGGCIVTAGINTESGPMWSVASFERPVDGNKKGFANCFAYVPRELVIQLARDGELVAVNGNYFRPDA